MKMKILGVVLLGWLLSGAGYRILAQTFTDGQMMGQGLLCNSIAYTHDSWTDYWEGSLRRDNLNLGRVSTRSVVGMSALGLAKNLNIMAMLPYVSTKASAGTLRGMQGFQDLTIGIKYRPLDLRTAGTRFSIMLTGAVSSPVSNYTADFLPLAIGLEARTLSGRLITHFRHHNGFFVTTHGGYVWRSNIEIDRTAYFTDRQYNTNQVAMPAQIQWGARTGYMQNHLIAEVFVDQLHTMGGSDIRRNDMPFPSNRMNATRIGTMLTWRPDALKGLGFTASAAHVLAGRNVGASSVFSASAIYIIRLWGSDVRYQ